jgi:hypothetical protein
MKSMVSDMCGVLIGRRDAKRAFNALCGKGKLSYGCGWVAEARQRAVRQVQAVGKNG